MKCCLIVLIVGLVVGNVSADYLEDSWDEPNDWGKHSSSDYGPNVCPICDEVEDGGLAAFCYKKLISYLFNRNTFKTNENTGDMEKTIFFKVSAAQLAIIEKSTDIRDVDAAITEILTTAKVVKGASNAKDSGSLLWLFSDIIYDSFKIFEVVWSNSEIRFICFIAGFMMLIWFIHKRYNKNLIAVVTIGFFLFGYFYTYIECNRKLEADKVIAFVKDNEPPSSSGLINFLKSIFSTSKEDKHISKIQAQTKIDLPFCRPDRVLSMYISDMFLNQLELIIEKCMSMTKTFKDSMVFPYNIIAMLCVPALFIFITKLVFKYFLSPRVWLGAFSTAKASATNQPQLQHPQNVSQEDRITGSNLQLLLKAIANRNSQKEPLPSGVEVLECLENGSADRKSDESKSEDDFEPSINLDEISQQKAKKDS